MTSSLTPLRRGMADRASPEFEAEVLVSTDSAKALGDTLKAGRRTQNLSQEALAEEFGVSRQTVANWERAVHTPDLATLKALEKRLRLRAGSLTSGLVSRVIVAGYVMAGDHGAEAIHEPHPLPIDDVMLPFATDDDLAWLQVRGSSMMPMYRDGDLICYDADRPFMPEDCLRRMCIVQTADDRVLVKLLQPGTGHGRYDLISTNAEPLTDIVVIWASPVKAAYYR